MSRSGMHEAITIPAPQFDETCCEEGTTVPDFIDIPGMTESEFYADLLSRIEEDDEYALRCKECGALPGEQCSNACLGSN